MFSGLRHILAILLCTVLAGLPAVAAAEGQFSGSVGLNWQDYSLENNGDNTKPLPEIDARSFTQEYSFLYSNKNPINGGRAGYWSYSLGYQWTSLDVSFNDEDQNIDSGKLLYSGEMVFAPGGLPLRLEMFSYDLNQPATSSWSSIFLDRGFDKDLVLAGSQIKTGITFWGGIKNGSYLGLYREALAQIPKLLVDYSETYTRNLDSLNREHWRLRDLAFVSLNKKDNWFHYRVTEYQDLLDSSNDYEERAYILGTVDHMRQRQWINLTNWIQVSVDGSLEQIQAQQYNEDVYRLNLFSKMSRKDWNLSNFAVYERSLDHSIDDGRSERLNKILDIPVFASGQIDPRNRWRMSLIHRSEEELYKDVRNPDWTEHIFYTAFQFESQRMDGTLATSNVELDVKRHTGAPEGQALRAGLELRTDNRRDLPTTWLAEVSLGIFDGEENSYLEPSVTVAADHRASPTLRYGGRQLIAFGFGDYQANATEYLRPKLTGTAGYSQTGDYDLSGSPWRATTNLFLEVNSSSRWQHRFEADADFLDRGEDLRSQVRLSHNARYSEARWNAEVKTNYVDGDDVDLPYFNMELSYIDTFVGEPERAFSSLGSLNYQPQRNWSTGLTGGVFWGSGDGGSTTVAALTQKSSYALFASGGARSKLFELEQELSYEHYLSVDSDFAPEGDTPWYAGLRLAAAYYPYRLLTLGARAEFKHYGLNDADQIEYGLTASVPLQKFTVQVAYEYAAADGWVPDGPPVKEQRWEVDIKKTF